MYMCMKFTNGNLQVTFASDSDYNWSMYRFLMHFCRKKSSARNVGIY